MLSRRSLPRHGSSVVAHESRETLISRQERDLSDVSPLSITRVI